MLNIEPAAEQIALQLALAVRGIGGRALAVGGCVRDALMGRPSREVDLEVFGVQPERLQSLMEELGLRCDLVGQAFGVLKIKGAPIDVSIPRKETKLGLGHQGFAIDSDPSLTFEQAAARRDFTCNAIGLDPLSGELLDPYGGQGDIQKKILRHVGVQFAEDPLRVLRAMQFLARFEFQIARETLDLCSCMTPENLPAERLFGEWEKLFVAGKKPSLGLTFLRECGWTQYYPELAALIDCPQEPLWHPEGDVWTHTLHAMDAFAQQRIGDPWEDLVVGLAVLCHDFGKPSTTATDPVSGRIRSIAHEIAGEGPTRSFLGRITAHKELLEAVVALVVTHMRPNSLYEAKAGDAAIRRLAVKVGRIDRLVRVCRADVAGRPPLDPDDFPAGQWLLARAHELSVADEAPKPIALGRHLIDLGMQPGPAFKQILSDAYEAQMEGHFADTQGAVEWLKMRINEK